MLLFVQQVTSGRWPSLDFRRTLLAGHGLSLLLTTSTADGCVSQLLFDGGPSEELWMANAERLGVDLAGLEAAVLSHWLVWIGVERFQGRKGWSGWWCGGDDV